MKRKVLLLCLSLMLSLSLLPFTAFAQDASFSLSVNNDSPAVGQNIQVTVTGDQLTDMYGYEINLTFDSNRLRYVKASSPLPGFSVPMAPKDGKLVFAHTKVGKVAGEDGKAVLATITFEAIGTSHKPTVVGLSKVELVKSDLTSTIHAPLVELEVTPVGKPVTFNDLNGHWAKEEIEWAAGLGFVNGYTDNSFRPQNHVTRAEFTAMIVRALELESTSSTVLDFADLERIPEWAKPFISEALSAGIVTGYQDGTFRPQRLINRAEMAVMVMRTLDGNPDIGLKPTFEDSDSIAAWAQPSVAAAAEAGLLNGRGNNRFEPAANTTRAEAVVLILRLMDYKNSAASR
ncbi:S-layer homology domain-containing protein [Paenibacillus sp. 598K]|uniref:S-layer homology domain-containing protein n=1 Tax=Paenibacillus sp. 598K TaxID=1117987 RepID=UPI0021A9C210|nr:S-layer homology domain-containing protein [Paenibacillus sp. 598K]